MSTITIEEQQKIQALIVGMPTIASGVGTRESACSIAAINLALSEELTDKIPDCMSTVIGKWIIAIQDEMPAALRNSPRWRSLLPRAAGTGRELEKERSIIILDWMWGMVLPQLQPIADKYDFGEKWKVMLVERTSAAADAALVERTSAAARAADAADAADAAALAAAYAAEAAYTAARAAEAADAALAALAAAYAAAYAAYAAADAADYWTKIDPCSLLEKLNRG